MKASLHTQVTGPDVQFGSWAYNGNAIDLIAQEGVEGMDISEYLINGEWTLDS
jgi:hypothetical protein